MSRNDRKNPERTERSSRAPTHDEIAERAYARYQARRHSDHDRSPDDDWYEAERELREAPDTPPIDPEETSIYAAPPYPARAEMPTARSESGGERRTTGEPAAGADEADEGDEDVEEVESFSPLPESAEKTHGGGSTTEELPESFSPREEGAKTTRAPRQAKASAGGAKSGKGPAGGKGGTSGKTRKSGDRKGR